MLFQYSILIKYLYNTCDKWQSKSEINPLRKVSTHSIETRVLFKAIRNIFFCFSIEFISTFVEAEFAFCCITLYAV